jgi:hypothetical protein
MATQSFSCPSCGAPLTLENRFTKVVICQYCGQTSNVTPAGLDPTGQKALLADFPSILSIGAEGSLSGTPFRVLGRLRYKYDEGFWDEWFLQLDGGRKVWLQEDEGTFVAFDKAAITSAIPEFRSIKVGSTIQINGREVFVVEKNEAVIAGGEGELLFSIHPGEQVDYVDGNTGGKVVSIEFAPDEIAMSIGEQIQLTDIKINKA